MESSSVDLFKNLKTSSTLDGVYPVIIIAENIRTPENMGMILRLAGNIGALKTFFAYDTEIDFRNSKVRRSSSGAIDKVSWELINTDEIRKKVPEDYNIIALETTENATNIFDFEFPLKTALLVGNEVTGVTESTLEICNSDVMIPVPGTIYSLNVTHALAIGLFQWYAQFSKSLKSP